MNTSERLAATGLAISLTLGAFALSAPEADAATRATTADIVNLQEDLNELVRFGMPRLSEDGRLGPQTRRALCAKRLFTGGLANLGDPSKEEIKQLELKNNLSYFASGLIVSNTCNVLGVSNVVSKGVTTIFPISAGKTSAGFSTPVLNTSISFARTGWHDSTLYPSESGYGNMYYPVYFKSGGGLAIHGSEKMNSSVTTDESHGCIRTSLSDQNKLWRILNGPITTVQDKVVSVRPVAVRVLK